MGSKHLDHKVQVLVVEDSDINRLMLVKQLRFIGCNAVAVNNGQQAVEYCQNHSVDMILMDCLMPVLDGYQATTIIRQHSSRRSYDTPVIIGLTACAMVGDRQKCLAAGMNDYLAKPAFVKDLKAVLYKWSQPVAV